MNRTLIWKSMLDADMNARYWGEMVSYYTNQEFRLKIFVAFATSSSVGGWMLLGGYPWFHKIASLTAAVASIYITLRKHTKLIEDMSHIRESWIKLETLFELQWNKGSHKGFTSELDKQYQQARSRQDAVTAKESKLPKIKRLLKKCQQEVIRIRKIQK